MYGEKTVTPDHSYRQYLKSSGDLVTSRDDVRAGFVALVLERNRKATPTVERARALKAAASAASRPNDLTKIEGIESALLTAAGVSNKAASNMENQDKTDAIQALIKNFLEPAGEKFVEELVYRFLLTCGDALGGSMRNIGGVLAQRKFTRSLLAALSNAGVRYDWLHIETNRWVESTGEETDRDIHLKGIHWTDGERDRTLVYNARVPLVEKNVDLCLLACSYRDLVPQLLANPAVYIALGELKGGIDPAGFDEHWKTVRSSFTRIRGAFASSGFSPRTFFVANGIAKSMATEIWGDLQRGVLTSAANLTKPDQIALLARWLISL